MGNGPKGFQWELFCKSLKDLGFSSDIALFAHRHCHMQEKLINLVRESAKLGLTINVAKTVALSVCASSSIPLLIGEYVQTLTST
jgi:hypothetical protein